MRDPEASDSFTLDQLEEVFRIAGSTTVMLQTGDGWCRDSNFLGRTTKTLAYTGMHISVLSGGWRHDDGATAYHPPLDSSAIRGDFLYWRRPKNQKPIAMPIKKDISPWLGAFLDQKRPRSVSRYQQLLDELSEKVGFSCNPLRFRHTCGVILYHVLKLDGAVVQRMLGCTAQTLLTYIIRTKEEIRKEMVEKGW